MSILSTTFNRLYTFVAGKRAESQKVNDELDQLVNGHNSVVNDITGIDVRITVNETNITDNENRISNNETDIANLQTTKADKTYVDLINSDLENLITSNDGDIYDLELGIDALNTNKASKIELDTHKTSADHDGRYYPKNDTYNKTELDKGTLDFRYPTRTEIDVTTSVEVTYEVFTIVNANNGDGTFTYTDEDSNVLIGILNGTNQIFALNKGGYSLGSNRISAIVNDTLHRSVVSGGLVEIDSNTIELTVPELSGAEITFVYYQALSGLGSSIAIGTVQPTTTFVGKIWIDTN